MKGLHAGWEAAVVSPETAIRRITPGMSIFLGTAVAEPRTMVRYLMTSPAANLDDLEFIQLVSFGDAVSLQALRSRKFRLKTFFSGWVADEAIRTGRVDMIPSRFVAIARLIESGQIPIDVAIVQITPPNEAGYCSLGIAVDVAREALEKASIRIGEINPQVPRTFGDTHVEISEFDFLVRSGEPPIYLNRWGVDNVWDRVASHVATLIDDESCLAFSIGPLFEALAVRLSEKRHLGIHSPFFTDPLMDLMRKGVATNRRKESYRGKALTSYAFGTPELFAWLNNNPLVEFQRVAKVFNPQIIGRNPRFVTVVAARKVDLYGCIGLYSGKGNIASGPAEVSDFLKGAELSKGGRSIFALTSRDRGGKANVRLSIAGLPNQFSALESVGTVVTEYGIAYLEGRSVRERAQALIDVAHPDDRASLVEAAKKRKILYRDQIFLADCARLYPSHIAETFMTPHGVKVSIRAIKPSDEEGMRHLFYRLSDEAVYSRYCQNVKSMPHAKMQAYVNVDWNRVMSVVGWVGGEREDLIVAEGRFIKIPGRSAAEIVLVVDEAFQRLGIASFLYRLLIRLARERGLRELVAEVLSANIGVIMKVLRKGKLPVTTRLESGVYHLEIPLFPENQPH
jgi:acyl-CoA hydrolase/GNAT superfamily N-acetyltransferase